ncbi:MAG: sensor histidine kinase [Thermoanaerobaculia bacterium]
MRLPWIERLPIARKGLFLFILLAAAQLAFAALLVVIDHARARDLAAERAVRRDVFAAHELAGSLTDLHVQLRGYLLNGEPGLLTSFDQRHASARLALGRLPDDSSASRRMRRAGEALLALQEQTRRHIAAGRLDQALESLRAPAIARITEFRAAHAEYNQVEEQRLVLRESTTRTSTRRVTTAAIGGVVMNLLYVLGLGGTLARSASRRLRIIVENTKRLERGEPIGPPLPPGDEISEVDRAFHRMAMTVERQKAELRQINGEVESFAYSVSHDLRAPLRAVSGYAEMIEEDHGDRLDETARRYLASMRGEAARMGQLIDDLLRFSRVSRQSLNIQTLDVAALATSCLAELRAEQPERRMAILIESLPRAEGDPSLVRVVLMNLLSNAVKYSAGRDVAVIRVTGEVDGGQCVFHVQDNGVGFDMRYAAKLFTVFQRLHRDDEFEGTGVGLALVARIVQRHGGRVSATGAVGAGATFTFTLPAAQEARDAA